MYGEFIHNTRIEIQKENEIIKNLLETSPIAKWNVKKN